MPLLALHPEAKIIRTQLRQNLALRQLTAAQWQELEPLLEIADYPKGERLEHQGDRSMEQYFILDGILKRVVANAQGHEMILRFAPESDIDTSNWRPISISHRKP
jgi:CRP-like cAMP-binding protein